MKTSPLYPLLWILSVAALFQVVFVVLRASVLRQLQYRIESQLIDTFHSRLFSRHLQYYSQRYPSELASRALLNTKLSKTIVYGFLDNLANIAAVIPITISLFLLSPLLALLSILLLSGNIVLYWLLGRHRNELGQRLSVVQAKLYSVGVESIETIETIHSSGSRHNVYQAWHQSLRELLIERTKADGLQRH